MTLRDNDRFWKRVNKNGPIPDPGKYPELKSPCWEWDRPNKCNGYGAFSINRKAFGAHRVSFEMHNGDIPEGLSICHRCDNPRCVNPDHLFSADQAANNRDASKKGRVARGSTHHWAKISEEDVRKIREEYETTFVSYKQLGMKYNVSQYTIKAIVKKVNWAHVE